MVGVVCLALKDGDTEEDEASGNPLHLLLVRLGYCYVLELVPPLFIYLYTFTVRGPFPSVSVYSAQCYNPGLAS